MCIRDSGVSGDSDWWSFWDSISNLFSISATSPSKMFSMLSSHYSSVILQSVLSHCVATVCSSCLLWTVALLGCETCFLCYPAISANSAIDSSFRSFLYNAITDWTNSDAIHLLHVLLWSIALAAASLSAAGQQRSLPRPTRSINMTEYKLGPSSLKGQNIW